VTRALLLLPLALLAAGCFGGGGGGQTLTWAVSAAPLSLDGALAPDRESRRVIGQALEGLVAYVPGTTNLKGALATEWHADATAKAWTFRLRPGVTFQDGTPLTAAVVCANFERWFHLRGRNRSLDRSYYWQRTFGGFAGQKSLYKGCSARGDDVVLRLTRPNSAFVSALPLPAFSIASRASLGSADPIGTGPFKVVSRTPAETVLVRNDHWWGGRPTLEKVVFQVIPSDRARLRALEEGDVDAFDLATAHDVAELHAYPELQVSQRSAADVAYMTINQAKPPMDKLVVREAVAYGLDRQRLADSISPKGAATVADQFQPPIVFGYAGDAPEYSFKPAESQRLLRLGGLTPPVPVELWYPTGVSRPYLPDPAAAAALLARGLRRSGFAVTLRKAPWPEYLRRVQEGRAGQLNLVGWTGDFGDPNDFLGTFFSRRTPQFAYDDKTLFTLLSRAAAYPSGSERATLYSQANARLLTALPGVPLVHTAQNVALSGAVQGYLTSPFGPESLAGVSVVR
jgi:peptide/nickel transport system substrate-binding protein